MLEKAPIEHHVFTTNISNIYSNADIIILPSRHEGFGLVFLEAWHYGVLVICSPNGGLPELVGQTLAPGGFISTTGTATALTIRSSGREIT
jgi:glycosyltransferase involved in cell wall biosynthesis